jgi:hypothetical protein
MTARAALPSERRFYTGMAIAMFVAVFVGFSQSFFLRPLFPGTPSPAERLFYLHGALFTAWIVLLVTQATLVAKGRLVLHRRLGTAGAWLAAAMIALGVYAALVAANRPGGFIGVPVPPLQFLIVPLTDMVLFGTLVALAVANRREAQTHKRLMLLATINLTTAAFARFPLVADAGPLAAFALTDAFVVALAVWDFRTRGRLHPATLWGGLAIIASQPLRLVLSGTAPWLAFATWLAGMAR